MYHAATAFAPDLGSNEAYRFLRDLKPHVLSSDRALLTLEVTLGSFSGPPELGPAAEKKPVKLFNPSIAAAPVGLCRRCAFIAAVRADVLHQCDASSPLFEHQSRVIAAAAFFKATMLLILDSKLRAVGWTWLISQPHKQVATWPDHGRQFVPAGSADGFAPPWNQQVYDARLLNVDGQHLFITYNCMACKFSVSQVHLTRELTPDGGLKSLRAWTSQRISIVNEWLQGRNQALFAVPADEKTYRRHGRGGWGRRIHTYSTVARSYRNSRHAALCHLRGHVLFGSLL